MHRSAFLKRRTNPGINDSDYLLMEPTGLAKIPLSNIAKRGSTDIAGNMYIFEEIPKGFWSLLRLISHA
jgi:hypothetical protein